MPRSNFAVNRMPSYTIGQPTAFQPQVGAINPYAYAPAYAPLLANGYVGPYAGFRPSTYTIPGRYNAYPWTGLGIYAGSTGTFGYYNGYGYLGGYFGPRYAYGSDIPLGLDTTYIGYAGYWSNADAGYNAWYPGSAAYSIDLPVMAYSPIEAPPSAEPPAPDDRTILVVRVPFEATVTVQGAVTKQIGENRTFVSPPLEPGRDYDYTIKAQWKEGDKSVEQSQTVTVRPGQRTAIMFLSTAGNVTRLPDGR
jgi:uncharacterized protein (TIGR03000 family)